MAASQPPSIEQKKMCDRVGVAAAMISALLLDAAAATESSIANEQGSEKPAAMAGQVIDGAVGRGLMGNALHGEEGQA
jgi:hypothetical protein